MHWTYKEALHQDLMNLEQGDLLRKTPELQSLLKTYHPYYADHPQNKFFIVLTQSCDLVKRSGSCKSKYISLAPVRTLSNVLNSEFENHIHNRIPSARSYASMRTRTMMEQFLESIFNNNDPAYFYLEKSPVEGIAESMCALLSLPISIKTDHYDLCFKARTISLKDEFQAKIGWLIGQLYSRVGTRDWEARSLTNKINDEIAGTVLWLSDNEVIELKSLCEQHILANPHDVIDTVKLKTLIAKIPKKKDSVIMRILELASEIEIFKTPSNERLALRRALEKDNKFATFF